jgi:hypothetical protein
MRAIGDVYDIGGKHFVSRASLLTYIEAVIKADDPALAHRARLDVSHAKPRPRPIGQEIPKELRSVMVRDLPTDITLEPGRLEIRGPNAERIVEMLVLLAQALQNDLHTATQLLDPPRIQLEHVDLELRAMFAELRAKENEHQLAKARSSVCTAVKTGGS